MAEACRRWRRFNGTQYLKDGAVGFSGINRQSDFPPGRDGVSTKLAMIGGGQVFAMKKKKIGDLAVS